MATRITKLDKDARKGAKLLKGQKQLTNAEINKAMKEAASAIDALEADNNQLKRMMVWERAQLIYFTNLVMEYTRGQRVVGTPIRAFNELPEPEQQKLVARAVAELKDPRVNVPVEEALVERPPAKKLIT
jgi:phosphoribosyl-ATP pyrophosphohydrolase